MIQELFLYDRERGLFKEILKQSSIIEGRYHVSHNHANDLNTSNLETFIRDPATGLSDPAQKYPICVCITPRSRYVDFPGGLQEVITFNLYFVCTTYRTGDNKIKNRDADTNTSAHHIWYDWQDMKVCAQSFLEVLRLTLKRKIDIAGQQIALGVYVNVDSKNAIFNRLTKFNNDLLTGVGMSFNVSLSSTICETADYTAIEDITIPPIIIHDANDDF